MANVKISDNSAFVPTSDITTIDGLAGYSGATNSKISGNALISSLEGNLNLTNFTTGILPETRGGTGLTSIATLENVNVDYNTDGTGVLPVEHGGTGANTFSAGFLKANGTSAFTTVSTIDLSSSNVSNVLPANKGGTGVAGTPGDTIYTAVQQFIWTDGTPIGYNSFPNNTGLYLPFDPTPVINKSSNPAIPTSWTALNSAQGDPNITEQCTFTLGAGYAGTWRIDVMVPMFDLDDFTTARLALLIDATEIAIFEHSWQAGRTFTGGPAQSLYGNLTYTFSGGENIKVLFYGDGSGGGFYPAGASGPQPFFNNRPPEITFTRIL